MSGAAAPANSEPLDLYGRPSITRRVSKFVGWGICMLAVLTIAAPLIWVLYGVISRALPVWRWSVLTELGTGTGGGLANELVGTLAHRGRRRDPRRYCRRVVRRLPVGVRPRPQRCGVEGGFRGAGRHTLHCPRLRRLHCVGRRPALAVLVGGRPYCAVGLDCPLQSPRPPNQPCARCPPRTGKGLKPWA